MRYQLTSTFCRPWLLASDDGSKVVVLGSRDSAQGDGQGPSLETRIRPSMIRRLDGQQRPSQRS